MGWTGALAGLGKGMMDYATIMGEQRKQDWLMQRDEVLNQRNLELESLRNKNNLKVAEYQDAKAIERDKLNFGQGIEQRKLEFGQGITQRELEFKQKMEAEDAQFGKQLTRQQAVLAANQAQELNLLEKKNQLTLENMDVIAQKTLDLELQKKDKVYKTLVDKLPEGTPEDVKNNLQLAVYSPELVTLISSDKRASADAKKAAMNDITEVFKEGLKAWETIPEEQQEKWDKKAKKAGEPSGQIAYANMLAANTPGVQSLLGGTSGSQKTMSLEEQGKQLQQDIINKKQGLTLEEAKAKIPEGHPLRKYIDDLDTTKRLSGNEPLSSRVSSVWNESTEPVVGAMSNAARTLYDYSGRNVKRPIDTRY